MVLTLILLVATSMGDLSLYVKLDAFQRATVSLVEAQNKTRSDILTEVLKQVKNGQDKTDGVSNQAVMIARQTVEIAKQTEDLSRQTNDIGRQNAEVLADLKKITTAHTKSIEEARAEAAAATHAAQRARASTIQTQKSLNTPWYKRVFK